MTASRNALLALAERSEKSGGANSDIDRCVQAALAGATPEWQEYANAWAYHRDGHWVSIGAIQPYTGSLDAAMGLVPKGWQVERGAWSTASPEDCDNASRPNAGFTLCGTSVSRMGRKRIWGHSAEDGRVDGHAATPALALTAASLRALAEQAR